jgi:hypothetical protein
MQNVQTKARKIGKTAENNREVTGKYQVAEQEIEGPYGDQRCRRKM